MNESGERRETAPLIHGRMLYRCECCGESWFMYLEKGIEEFGENHKPSPFMIACPHCGGFASDVSGIQKAPGGGYVPLPGGCRYFANMEDRDCGVPMLYETGIVPSGAKIVVVGLGRDNRSQQAGQTVDEEVLEDIRARAEKYIEDFISAELLELAAEETRKFIEAAVIFAEQTGYSVEEAIGAIKRAIDGPVNPKRLRRELSGLMAEREKRRAVERETASRFRQRKVQETAWAVRKRTGARQREWRGPWRGERTN